MWGIDSITDAVSSVASKATSVAKQVSNIVPGVSTSLAALNVQKAISNPGGYLSGIKAAADKETTKFASQVAMVKSGNVNGFVGQYTGDVARALGAGDATANRIGSRIGSTLGFADSAMKVVAAANGATPESLMNSAQAYGQNYVNGQIVNAQNTLNSITSGNGVSFGIGALSSGFSSVSNALQRTPLAGLGARGFAMASGGASNLLTKGLAGASVQRKGAAALTKIGAAGVGAATVKQSLSTSKQLIPGVPTWALIAGALALGYIVLK